MSQRQGGKQISGGGGIPAWVKYFGGPVLIIAVIGGLSCWAEGALLGAENSNRELRRHIDNLIDVEGDLQSEHYITVDSNGSYKAHVDNLVNTPNFNFYENTLAAERIESLVAFLESRIEHPDKASSAIQTIRTLSSDFLAFQSQWSIAKHANPSGASGLTSKELSGLPCPQSGNSTNNTLCSAMFTLSGDLKSFRSRLQLTLKILTEKSPPSPNVTGPKSALLAVVSPICGISRQIADLL